MTPKNIHKIIIPKKIFIFLKPPKNIEIQDFEPKKWSEPMYVLDRQTNRQTDRQPGRREDRQTDRQTDMLITSRYL